MNDDLRCAGVYALTNVENGKVYIGQSQNIEQRIYQHFHLTYYRTHINYAIKKHGTNAFTVTLLERVDDLALLDAREEYWITTLHACDRQHGYNLRPGGKTTRGFKHTIETKAKMSASSLGKPKSDEARAKMSAAHKGQPMSEKCRLALRAVICNPSPETREKLRQTSTGRLHTAETKAKISAAHKGKSISAEAKAKRRASLQANPISDETRAKLSAARKGKPISAEHKAKLLAAIQGHTVSAETRAKISAANKGKPPSAASIAASRAILMGKSLSDKTKAKMSAALRDRNHTDERAKLIVEYIEAHQCADWNEISAVTDSCKTTIIRHAKAQGWHRLKNGNWTQA